MIFTGLNHLAFITPDIEKTIRFYRDLLEMPLVAGIGHDGYRHYLFQIGDGAVAFFTYDGAKAMAYDKFHGAMTEEPIGYDHVSFTVPSRQDLFALKDRLEAAGIEVRGAVDHGTIWSIYFFDPNNIPLEASWNCVYVGKVPVIEDDDPLDIVVEGSDPQPGHWPAVTTPTSPEDMVAHSGNGNPMRDNMVRNGLGRNSRDLDIALAQMAKRAARDATE